MKYALIYLWGAATASLWWLVFALRQTECSAQFQSNVFGIAIMFSMLSLVAAVWNAIENDN